MGACRFYFPWYAEAVRWAASVGIVAGRDGLFAPNAPITREELAAMLFRYESGKNGAPAERADLAFPDAGEASAWAVDALSWCVYRQIIGGQDMTLVPRGAVTRAEAARMLRLYAGA